MALSGAATGMIVQLPGWHYPVVVDTLSGTMQYDNYAGHWGDQQELDSLLDLAVAGCTDLAALQRAALDTVTEK